MKKRTILFFLFIPLFLGAQVQRKTSYNDMVWFGDFSKLKINERWGVYFDVGLRRTEWLEKWSQTLLRPGVIYNPTKNVSITVGVAYFNHYSGSIIRPEYRGWQQLLFTDNFGRLKVSHRLRAEQRLNQRVVRNELVDDYQYNNRYRYQLSLQIALNKKEITDRTFYFIAADEIMANSGKEISYNYFDQNRLSAGFGFKWNEKLNIAVSYMNVFIQKNQPAYYEKNNVLVLNLYHNFEFKRKKKDKH